MKITDVAAGCGMTPGLFRAISGELGVSLDQAGLVLWSHARRVAAVAQERGLIGPAWTSSPVWSASSPALASTVTATVPQPAKSTKGCGTGCLVLIALAVLVIVATAVGSAISGGDDEADVAPPPTAPGGGYQLDFLPSIDGTSVVISGSTNLPNDTRVTFPTFRPFLNSAADPDTTRVAGAGGASATVVDGGFSASIPIEEPLLLLVADSEPIEVLSDSLLVCAQVRNGVSTAGVARQPDGEVQAALGIDGSALEGSLAAQSFGELSDSPSTYLEVSTPIGYSAPVDQVASTQGFAPSVAPVDGFCLY